MLIDLRDKELGNHFTETGLSLLNYEIGNLVILSLSQS